MREAAEIKRDALLLRENAAFTRILNDVIDDLVGQFMSTDDDKLIELKRRAEAVNSLRGKIESAVLTLSETGE